jgi:hypothetical protein
MTPFLSTVTFASSFSPPLPPQEDSNIGKTNIAKAKIAITLHRLIVIMTSFFSIAGKTPE